MDVGNSHGRSPGEVAIRQVADRREQVAPVPQRPRDEILLLYVFRIGERRQAATHQRAECNPRKARLYNSKTPAGLVHDWLMLRKARAGL
jgi:hypothetical protein